MLKKLWADGKPDLHFKHRREQAAWLTRINGQYNLVPANLLESTPCTVSPDFATRPDSTIALIHLHPYFLDEIYPRCDKKGQPIQYPNGYWNVGRYPGGLSETDVASVTSEVPIEFMMDRDTYIKFNSAGVLASARRCSH